jgi:uncharacterized protein YjbI with pentapeptide repeats
MEIKHRYTGEVLFTAKGATTVAAAVVMAVAAGANLYGANLSRANLYGANLYGANLYGANLYGANLSGADLSKANLYGANLYGANLYGANLSGADLSGADLSKADLSGANLSGANLNRASLDGASLKNVKGLFYQIPQEGELIVWKAVAGGVCRLRIPPEAKRTASMIGRKCRAEWVEVLEAPTNGAGLHDSTVIYRAGEVVRPDKYDPDPRVECTHGIHFFLTKDEAEAYR